MKNTCIIFTIIVLLIFTVCFTGCKERKLKDEIRFDNSNPLDLAFDISWAVVTEPYATYKTQMGWNAPSGGYVRHADILQVKGKSVDENGEVWYLFDDGWLSKNSVSIYNNYLRAKNASNSMEQ
jgi:hypothetical protein